MVSGVAIQRSANVCFVPIADIPVVSPYRADFSSNVFYKPTPYWPVCSRIFLRACKTACGGDIENFRTSKKRVAMIRAPRRVAIAGRCLSTRPPGQRTTGQGWAISSC